LLAMLVNLGIRAESRFEFWFVVSWEAGTTRVLCFKQIINLQPCLYRRFA
jgi:hypothetical protein